MKYLIIILVGSVFLGTEFLAIPTPALQLTIYRVCALSIIPLIGYFLIQKNEHLKIKKNSYAFFTVAMYGVWLLWAVTSLLWVEDLRLWLQSVFLLTVGISSILALYLWINNMDDWKKVIKTSWVMMTFLMLLGYYEIITNHYIFANLDKLDKYNTFSSQPLTRIPITHFENQNDFSIMLLGYLALTIILYYMTSHVMKRFIYLFLSIMTMYLVYRTGSRLALLSLALYILSFVLLRFKIDFKAKHYITAFVVLITSVILSIIFIPSVQDLVISFLNTGRTDYLSGDAARINLLRNGLLFLASTIGIGVGAGNIEFWMGNYGMFPTNNIINMHNWWGEILVAYGIGIFVLYVLAYGLLLSRLFQIRRYQSIRDKYVTNQLISFLFVFIIGSMVSSNNILIEWHWVFFGLIVAYVKVNENKITVLDQAKRRSKYELNYNFE